LSKIDIDSWNQRHLKFMCRTCARSGNEYNNNAALKRYVMVTNKLFIVIFMYSLFTFHNVHYVDI